MQDIEELDGLYVSMLLPDEIKLLDEAIKQGRAIRSYEGPSGFLGLAKVKVYHDNTE